MQKVPVFDVVQDSYRFLFRELVTIVRLAWFPVLVATVFQVAANYLSIDAQVAAGGFDRPLPGGLWWRVSSISVSSIAVSIVAYAMVMVALHRLILFGDRKPGTFVLLSLGRTEWLFVAFALLAFVVTAVVLGLLAALTGATSTTLGLILVLLVAILAILAGIYWGTRFLLLFPAIVVEKRLDLRAALDLSRGNFWRLLGAILLASLPVLIVLMIVLQILVRPMVDDLNALAAASVDPLQTAGYWLKRVQLPMAIMSFIGSIVLIALVVAVICQSHSALRGIGPSEYLEDRSSHPARA